MFLLQEKYGAEIDFNIVECTAMDYKIPVGSCTETVLRKHSEKEDIPVGDISFVEAFLDTHFGIKHLTPTDIPKFLKTKEFLKRDYKIVDYDDIPKSGFVFFKDMSKIKGTATPVNLERLDRSVLKKDHKYQISDYLEIESEYRVYVIDHQIVAITHYDGSPLCFPDVNLIVKAATLMYGKEYQMKSYTIDVAVGQFGTAIIEIQNFICVGLYTTQFDYRLYKAFSDGIDYEIIRNGKVPPSRTKNYRFSFSHMF